jgi:hypothetical protein
MTTVTLKKDHVHEVNGMTIVGKFKKDWIRTPKQLGYEKLKVIDEFETLCNCGKHRTDLYILEKKYFTLYCQSKGWAWLAQPENIQDIYKLKV